MTYRPLYALCFLLVFLFTSSYAELELFTGTNGSYAISYNNVLWIKSAETYFYVNGKRYSNVEGTLNLTWTSSKSGLDTCGPWQDTTFQYKVDDTLIEARLKTYQTNSVPAFIFEQTYVNGAKGTKAPSANKTIGGFPSFTVQDVNTTLGYLSLSADMFGDKEKQLGVWSPKTIKIHDGLHGTGPVVIFDKNNNAILIAPFTSPLTMSTNYNKTDHSLSWGIMGGVDEVPPGYTISTIIVYSENGGINDVFDRYGKLVKYYFDKQVDFQPADITLSHLGYWTDNGGYYYYHTEPKKNYEDTILDIKKNMDGTKIPYRYMQLDSWWYYKDKNNAVTRWEPRPDIFPDGLQKLQEKLNLPLSLHNRYWSKDTPYAAKYLFLKGVGLSVPLTTKFWDFLFTRGKTWGMKMYEQDWMYVQFMFLEKMKSNLTLATTWLDAMATSAENNGMSIQYCMTQSRMAFQSLQYSPVTQARVSDDYHSLDDQWKIGISSLFAHAMGVRPSKDTFWTTTNQTGNPFNTTEPYPALQTLIAVLSTGPVGPSDGIGYTDKDLLMKCCNADGLILKPSKPATAIDDHIIEKAINDGSGARGEVYSTYSDFGEYIKQRYGIIVVANLSQSYNITPSKASFTVNINNFPESVIYDSANISVTKQFTEDKPYTLPVCLLTTTNYCLYYTSPVLYVGNNSKIVIYGETNKFVPMSQQRIYKFWNDANSLAVTIRGFPNENVTFVYSVDGMIKTTYNIIDQKTQCATVTLFGKPNIPSGIDCTYSQPTPQSRAKHQPFDSKDDAFRIRYDITSPDGFIIKFNSY